MIENYTRISTSMFKFHINIRLNILRLLVYLFNLDNITKYHFGNNFATFYFEIAVKWSKSQILEIFNRNIRETHIHDMVTIDIIGF